MDFRKALPVDIERMEKIIEQARASLKAAGVDQWQAGYPNRRSCEEDVLKNCAYVLDQGGTAVAMATLIFGDESDYEAIQGSWRGDGLYAVIHRMAVDEGFRRGGLASRMIAELGKICLSNALFAIRTDTHRDNKPMNALLLKNGFAYRGIIRLEYDGSERLAYEKFLEK